MTQLETRTEPMVVNFGPHHPSMHGVLRLVVTLDGEDVVDCEPVIGYLHRGMEKIAENRTNVMFVPYVSRMDYAAGMFYEAVVVNAPRGSPTFQSPTGELHPGADAGAQPHRQSPALAWPFLADVGAQTPFFYIFREREMIYDLWEAATGQRLINNNYFRIGGVAADLPWGWLEKCKDFCDWFAPKIDEYEKLITNNPIFRRRIEGLGTIEREDAINWSLSGPMLRASGVPWDLRKVDHYECYDDFDWQVAWEKEGDCYARYRVRMEEMRQSLKILRQACDMIPGGPTENLRPSASTKARAATPPVSTSSTWPRRWLPPSRSPTVSYTPGWSRARARSACSSRATTTSPPGLQDPRRRQQQPADPSPHPQGTQGGRHHGHPRFHRRDHGIGRPLSDGH